MNLPKRVKDVLNMEKFKRLRVVWMYRDTILIKDDLYNKKIAIRLGELE